MSVKSVSTESSCEYVEGDVKVATEANIEEENTSGSNEKIPEEFSKVINDLCNDIKMTFPETEELIK